MIPPTTATRKIPPIVIPAICPLREGEGGSREEEGKEEGEGGKRPGEEREEGEGGRRGRRKGRRKEREERGKEKKERKEREKVERELRDGEKDLQYFMNKCSFINKVYHYIPLLSTIVYCLCYRLKKSPRAAR